jgi:quercetin dioxygenase-like cupin family protein
MERVMNAMFRIGNEIEPTSRDWGSVAMLCNPPSTGAKQLTVAEAIIRPGQGHSFHQHPNQEEMIYVLVGEVEQWLDREKRVLRPGDSVFLPAGMVHASFNVGKLDATILAVFGPSIGEGGIETVEVADEAPWNGLRAT